MDRVPPQSGQAVPGRGETNRGEEYPVELSALDISAYRTGETGIPYVMSWEAPLPGPHALISAIVHGNELCGVHALDHLIRHRLRPVRGRLSLCFANVAAYETFDPNDPTQARYLDEDMNRVWDAEVLDGARDSQELQRARALRPLLDTTDYLLDLHSMQHPAEPLILAGRHEKGRAMAGAVGSPPLVVMDGGHRAGRRMRDYGRFSVADDPRTALLVECGQHWARTSVTVAIACCLRYLLHLALIDDAEARRLGDKVAKGSATATDRRVVEVVDVVTVETPDFRFVADFRGMEHIPAQGTVIAYDGERPVVTPCDDCILIMPSRRRAIGQTAVRLGRLRR